MKQKYTPTKMQKRLSILWELLLLSLIVIVGLSIFAVIKNRQNNNNIQSEHGSYNAEWEENKNNAQQSSEFGSSSLDSEFPSTSEVEETQATDLHPYDFTLTFAGDINLDENWATAQYLDTCENGIYDCISPELMNAMNEADIMCLNNEFTYSSQGEPLAGKMYTFRAKPERVKILQQMGVDVACLANNHTYDYGKQSLLDTLDTLENAGISYVGAGRNLNEAMRPVYMEQDGKVIAFVAASRAEKNKMTPQATDEEPGILRCYDNSLFLSAIRTARENADFVIALVHWGTEESTVLEPVQLSTGKEYIDAGADAVIGGHSHCLQGMEFYKGKPICYSLGDYWFNGKTEDTALITLHFSGDDTKEALELSVLPAIQSQCQTRLVQGEDQEKIFSMLESISINVYINEQGIVTEK